MALNNGISCDHVFLQVLMCTCIDHDETLANSRQLMSIVSTLVCKYPALRLSGGRFKFNVRTSVGINFVGFVVWS